MELPEGYWFFATIVVGMIASIYFIGYLLSLIGLNIDKEAIIDKILSFLILPL